MGKKKKVKKQNMAPEIQNESQNEEQGNLDLSFLLSIINNFEGGDTDNFRSYIKQFDAITDLAKLSDEVKLIILRAKFRKAALKVLQDNENLHEESNYKVFCESIRTKFTKPLDFLECKNKFMQQRQNLKESVQDYAERCKKNAGQFLRASELNQNEGASELTNKLLLHNFIEGLNPKIRYEVEKIYPNNLIEAINIAERVEKALKNCSTTENVNNITEKKDNELITNLLTQFQAAQDRINKLTKELKHLKSQFKNNNYRKQFQVCQLCYRTNHSELNCWFNKRNYPRSERQFTRSFNIPRRQNYYFRNPRYFTPRANRGYAQNYRHRQPYEYQENVPEASQNYESPDLDPQTEFEPECRNPIAFKRRRPIEHVEENPLVNAEVNALKCTNQNVKRVKGPQSENNKKKISTTGSPVKHTEVIQNREIETGKSDGHLNILKFENAAIKQNEEISINQNENDKSPNISKPQTEWPDWEVPSCSRNIFSAYLEHCQANPSTWIVIDRDSSQERNLSDEEQKEIYSKPKKCRNKNRGRFRNRNNEPESGQNDTMWGNENINNENININENINKNFGNKSKRNNNKNMRNQRNHNKNFYPPFTIY